MKERGIQCLVLIIDSATSNIATTAASPLRFSETRTHNAVHEIETLDPAPGSFAALTHDGKGNLTLDAQGNTYAWDFDNRLKEARNAAGDLLGSYTYDTMGRRVTKTVPGASQGTGIQTAFICFTSGGGMGQVLAEYETQSLKRLYTYGEYIDEAITLTTFDATNGEELFYFHHDRQYNITGLTNDSPSGGVVQERYAYTPYGDRRILAPDGITIRQISAVGNPIGHQGLYHDGETGLIYNRARYRDVELGRWLGRDQLDYIDSLNLYEFLNSHAYKYLDPTGNSLTPGIKGPYPKPPKPTVRRLLKGAGAVLGGGMVGLKIIDKIRTRSEKNALLVEKEFGPKTCKSGCTREAVRIEEVQNWMELNLSTGLPKAAGLSTKVWLRNRRAVTYICCCEKWGGETDKVNDTGWEKNWGPQ